MKLNYCLAFFGVLALAITGCKKNEQHLGTITRAKNLSATTNAPDTNVKNIQPTSCSVNGKVSIMWGQVSRHPDLNNLYYIDVRKIDDAGNVYTLSHTVGTYDIDPGPGVYMLTANRYALVKQDPSGAIAWGKDATVDGYDDAPVIATDPNNNVYLVYTMPGGAPTDPSFVRKMDPSGNVISEITVPYRLGGANIDAQGNIYSADGGNTVRKTGPAGNLIWYRTLPTTGIYSYSLSTTGSSYITGYTYTWVYSPVEIQTFSYKFIKYDTNGNLSWSTLLPHTDVSQDDIVTLDGQNNFYVYDKSASPSLLKFNASGKLLWKKTISHAFFTTYINADKAGNVYLLTIPNGGGIYINAQNNFPYDPNTDSQLICKFDPNGNFVWAIKPSADLPGVKQAYIYGTNISTDASGNLYYTGYLQDAATSWVIKYKPCK